MPPSDTSVPPPVFKTKPSIVYALDSTVFGCSLLGRSGLLCGYTILAGIGSPIGSLDDIDGCRHRLRVAVSSLIDICLRASTKFFCMKGKTENRETKLSFADAPKATEQEIAAAAKSMSAVIRAVAWQVHRWPMERRICDTHTKIHLPHTYLAGKGEEVQHVRRGADINQLVHRHYIEYVSEEQGKEWTNFVHTDNVVTRR